MIPLMTHTSGINLNMTLIFILAQQRNPSMMRSLVSSALLPSLFSTLTPRNVFSAALRIFMMKKPTPASQDRSSIFLQMKISSWPLIIRLWMNITMISQKFFKRILMLLSLIAKILRIIPTIVLVYHVLKMNISTLNFSNVKLVKDRTMKLLKSVNSRHRSSPI